MRYFSKYLKNLHCRSLKNASTGKTVGTIDEKITKTYHTNNTLISKTASIRKTTRSYHMTNGAYQMSNVAPN